MILPRCGDGFTEGLEMLEASRMDRTDVTQGDLEELCDQLTPGEGSALTPASVESASRTLTGFNISNIIFILLYKFFGSNLVRGVNACPVTSYSSRTCSQPPSSRLFELLN